MRVFPINNDSYSINSNSKKQNPSFGITFTDGSAKVFRMAQEDSKQSPNWAKRMLISKLNSLQILKEKPDNLVVDLKMSSEDKERGPIAQMFVYLGGKLGLDRTIKNANYSDFFDEVINTLKEPETLEKEIRTKFDKEEFSSLKDPDLDEIIEKKMIELSSKVKS